MKVILLKDVAKIGRRSAVVEVPDGYAQNQLIPKRLAEPATLENLKKVSAHSARKAVSASLLGETFAHACSALRNATLTITAEANNHEHLFRGIHAADVVQAAAAAGVALEPEMVVVPNPIKTLGEHEIVLTHGVAREVITIIIARK